VRVLLQSAIVVDENEGEYLFSDSKNQDSHNWNMMMDERELGVGYIFVLVL
jgi:hypothetical protein